MFEFFHLLVNQWEVFGEIMLILKCLYLSINFENYFFFDAFNFLHCLNGVRAHLFSIIEIQ